MEITHKNNAVITITKCLTSVSKVVPEKRKRANQLLIRV